MSQPKRINKSLREVTAIWRAIQNGDADLAERRCVDHINAAAVAALTPWTTGKLTTLCRPPR